MLQRNTGIQKSTPSTGNIQLKPGSSLSWVSMTAVKADVHRALETTAGQAIPELGPPRDGGAVRTRTGREELWHTGAGAALSPGCVYREANPLSVQLLPGPAPLPPPAKHPPTHLTSFAPSASSSSLPPTLNLQNLSWWNL